MPARMTRYGELSLLMATALIAAGLGPLDATAWAILTVLSIGWWAASALRQARDAGARGFVPCLAACGPPVLAMAAIPRLGDPLERLAALVMAVSLARTPARPQACRFAGFALGLWLVLDLVPLAWSTEVETSRLVSRGVGWLSGQSIDWGPSASGLELLLLALLLLLSRPMEAPVHRARRFLGCVGVWVGFLAMAPALAGWRPAWLFGPGGVFNQAREHLEAAPGDLAPSVFALSWILLAALGAVCVIGGGAAGEKPAAPRRPGFPPELAAGSAALVLAVILCAAWWPGAPRPHGRVALVRSRWIDFEVPRPDRHGIAASGMFGLLGRYLALDGHAMEIVDRPLTAASLRGVSIAIVPLPDAPLDRLEKEALDRFVRRGGSMLVLADHTDLLGTMGPINDLIASSGAQVRFDSAYPARRAWRGCVRTRRPLPSGDDTGIGTGASLAIRGMARPLVVGRHALGDSGDRANGGAGAFLGDYAWQPGERLGDLVLVSETRAGRGRVVVMGDTSSLQNVALPWCWPFVSALFDHLARRPPPWSGAAAAAAGIGGLALIGILLRSRRPAAWTAAAAAGVLGAALTVSEIPGPARPDPTGRPAPSAAPASPPVAVVVDGHLNAWTREMWRDGSLGGLMANLQRAGFLPVVTRGVREGTPVPETLMVLVAPRATLSQAEALRLAQHVERGGRVLVAAGAESSAAVAPLLSMYGLTVRGLPLGPVPLRPGLTPAAYEAARQEPQFRNAHPVEAAGLVPVRSFHRAFGHDVVVRARGRSGRGALIVVGDAEFLTDRVLENERAAWPGNVALLSRVLGDAP